MGIEKSQKLLTPELNRQAGGEVLAPEFLAPEKKPGLLASAFGTGRPIVEPAAVTVDGSEKSLIPNSNGSGGHMAGDFQQRAARVPDLIGEGEAPAGSPAAAAESAADPGAGSVAPAPLFFDPGEVSEFASEVFDCVADWRGVDGWRLTDRRAAMLSRKLAPVLNRVIHNALQVLPDSAAAAAEANPENVSLVIVLLAVCIPGAMGEFAKWREAKSKTAGVKTVTSITGSAESKGKSDNQGQANRL